MQRKGFNNCCITCAIPQLPMASLSVSNEPGISSTQLIFIDPKYRATAFRVTQLRTLRQRHFTHSPPSTRYPRTHTRGAGQYIDFAVAYSPRRPLLAPNDDGERSQSGERECIDPRINIPGSQEGEGEGRRAADFPPKS